MAHLLKKYMVALLFVLLGGLLQAQTVVSSPAQAKLMAKNAAIRDAQRNLAETIYGIRIDSRTTVRNFITEDDRIRSSVQAILRGARVVDTRWEDDGTCTVEMEVPVVLLQKALRRRFAYTSDVISAEGHGAPNPVAEGTPIENIPAPEESWPHLVIKGTGSGVAPAELKETPQGKLMAERAAFHDAIRNLGENIKGVHITSQSTVRNFITENDEIRTRFESFLQGARKVETRHLDDGTCEVDLEISLEGMRKFIHPGRRIIAPGGPTAPRPGFYPPSPRHKAGPFRENVPFEKGKTPKLETPPDMERESPTPTAKEP